MKTLIPALLAALLAAPVHANDAHHPPQAQPPAAETSDTVPAEVKRVDTASGKVTLSHGPLKNLGMPGMTMGFPVLDRDQLKGVSAGDRVTATLAKRDADYVVIRLDRSK